MTIKVFAYTLDGGSAGRNGKEFDLAAGNGSPAGVWSDGTTLWVADTIADKLFAYTLDDGTRDETKEFGLAAGNGSPAGVWSDGTTIWVADEAAEKLFAYTLDGGARDTGTEFDLAVGTGQPWGVWSDCTTMWVADFIDDRLYAYDLGPSLTDLAFSEGAQSPVFDSCAFTYTVRVNNLVDEVIVTPAVSESNATVTVTVNGALVTSSGSDHTVDLEVGSNTVTIVVTVPDRPTRTYAVNGDPAQVLGCDVERSGRQLVGQQSARPAFRL